MTADLERRLRALRDELPEPPVTIDPSAVVPEVTVLDGAAPPRRRRARWVVAALVAAALVVGVVVAVEVVRSGHVDRGAPLGVASPAPRIDPATQVVHDGDRVEGTGMVIAVDGEATVFCAPEPVALDAPFDPRDACHHSVTVTGVDLHQLSLGGTLTHGVWGMTHLVGTYRAGALTDVVQSAYRAADADDLPAVPCTPPAGGWPQGAADDNPDWGPVERYESAHAGEVVASAVLRPSHTQMVIYLVTAHDPAAVEAVLGPQIPLGLCVVQSVYTTAQLSAGAALVDFPGPFWKSYGAYSTSGLGGFGADGQPVLTVDLPFVTDGVVAAARGAVPGLIQFDPWLAPVSS